MRRIVIGLLAGILAASLAPAQTVPDRAIPGWCHTGAIHSTTAGVPSSTTVQGTVPRCTVTVYLTGTTTKAVIHGDPFNGVLPNPFTATSIGQWTFWAQPSVAYDIVLSGGIPPNTYPQPVTMTAVQVGGPGSGNTSPGGNPNELQFNGSNFFQGTTGLTWDSTNSVLKYPTGAISANTINAATALSAGAITASGAINAGTVTATGPINGASVNTGGGSYQVAIPWNTGLPNMANGLVGCTTGIGTVYACPVNSPSWNGIQVAGGPGSGSANSTLAVGGQASCTFDNSATVGDYAQLSQTVAGMCHDSGLTTLPSNGVPVVGQVVALGTAPQATVLLAPSGLSSAPGPAGPAGPAGPPGGSLSYPGVVSDSQNGIAMPGAVTASSSMGYRQSAYAGSRNRDDVLRISVMPQDMPGCANSGQGYIDDTPCFNAAIAYLQSQDNYADKRLLVPQTRKGYQFLSNGFLVTLPYDYGDYHGYAGFTTQPSVTPYFVNGALVSCGVTGGSGYVPNANLQVNFLDQNLQFGTGVYSPIMGGSGATATVQTDGTGAPLTCTVTNAGMNYSSTGVQTMVLPLGGDGAAGTATLSPGTTSFSITGTGLLQTCNASGNSPGTGSSPCTGSGYATGVPVGVAGTPQITSSQASTTNLSPTLTLSTANAAIAAGQYIVGALIPANTTVLSVAGTAVTMSANATGTSAGNELVQFNFPGLLCTTYPTFTATVTGTGVASVAVATAGSTCTYNGNSSATVPLVFGASCRGAQCTLLPPETPVNMPCAVALFKGLTIEGIGLPQITTFWTANGSVVNNSQIIAFCDPSGLQGTDITIKHLNINAFIGFYFPWEANHVTLDDLTFVGAIPLYAYSFGGNWAFSGNHSNHPRSTLSNSFLNSHVSGAVCSAAWAGRNPVLNAGSQQQTYSMLTNSGTTAGYSAFALGAYNNVNYSGHCAGIDISNVTAYNSIGSVGQANTFDGWFESNIWKTQNGPSSVYTEAIALLSTGLTTCTVTQTVADRTTDYIFGQYPHGNIGSNPFRQCFPGIAETGLTFYPRYSSTEAATNMPPQSISGYTLTSTQRNVAQGRFDTLWVTNIFDNLCSGVGGIGQYNNPQIPINITTAQSSIKAQVRNLVEECQPFPGANIMTNGLNSNSGLIVQNVSGVNTSGSFSVSVTPVAAGTCSATQLVANTGVGASEQLSYNWSAAPTGTVGQLVVNAWTTAGNINFSYCNPTAVSITPSGTLYWRILR